MSFRLQFQKVEQDKSAILPRAQTVFVSNQFEDLCKEDLDLSKNYDRIVAQLQHEEI